MRTYQQGQQQSQSLSPALSQNNLDRDQGETLSQSSNDSRRPSEVPDGQQPELWSNLTGKWE